MTYFGTVGNTTRHKNIHEIGGLELYTTTTLPSVGNAGSLVYISDANSLGGSPETFAGGVFFSDGTSWRNLSVPTGESPGGGVIAQIKRTSTGSLISTQALIPFDDTIPQISEGGPALSLAFTPTSATNRLLITSVASMTGFQAITAHGAAYALFKNPDTDALAAAWINPKTTGPAHQATVEADIEAGTTSEIIFSTRFGSEADPSPLSLYINGQDENGTRVFGGKSTAFLKVIEYTPPAEIGSPP